MLSEDAISDTTERNELQAALDELAAIANRIADERNELLAAAKQAVHWMRQHFDHIAADAEEGSPYMTLVHAIERAKGRS